MIDPQTKRLINSMSYESLLRKWRSAPIGDPMFLGELGTYFEDAMEEKGRQAGIDARVAASKAIGWEVG